MRRLKKVYLRKLYRNGTELKLEDCEASFDPIVRAVAEATSPALIWGLPNVSVPYRFPAAHNCIHVPSLL